MEKRDLEGNKKQQEGELGKTKIDQGEANLLGKRRIIQVLNEKTGI